MNNSKFKYAPGLPGYGTQGDDGSSGLPGLSVYFSSYDGQGNQATISQRIRDNRYLYETQASLPEGRSYSQGDFFIDANSRIWVITDPEQGSYEDSEQVFEATSPVFQNSQILGDEDEPVRYVNNYYKAGNAENAITADIVLTQRTGRIDHTANLDELYGIHAKDYPHIVFNDRTEEGYNHIMVFSSFTALEDTIALARNYSNKDWHFGNLDNNFDLAFPNMSLNLDFGSVNATKDLSVNENLNVAGNAYFTNQIKIGNGTDVGLIKWTGSDLQGKTGNGWETLTYRKQDVYSDISGSGVISFSNGTISHDESNASGVDSARFVNKISIDNYGHITDISTGSVTQENTFVTDATGNGNGTLTLTRSDSVTITADLSHNHNSTYLQKSNNLSDVNSIETARGNLYSSGDGISIDDTNGIISTNLSAGSNISFSTNNGEIEISASGSSDTNDYVSNVSFDDVLGTLTLSRTGSQSLQDVSTSLDGRYLQLNGGSMSGPIDMTYNNINTVNKIAMRYSSMYTGYIFWGDAIGDSWRMNVTTDSSDFIFAYQNVLKAYFDTDGDLRAHDFILYSDEELKKDISPIKGIDQALTLDPIKFTYKETGKKSIGFTAQNVQEAIPELVSKDISGYLTLSYQQITAVNNSAIHYLYDQLEEKDKEIQSLKTENQELKDRLDIIEEKLNLK